MNKKSVWAVVAGVLVLLVVTTLVDMALHAANVFPPMDQPINTRSPSLRAPIASASPSVLPGSQPGSRPISP